MLIERKQLARKIKFSFITFTTVDKMQPSYVNAIVAFVAAVSAAPSLQPRTYPTVATYEVTLGDVDPAYLAQLDTAVVNLDEGAATKRDIEARQSGTCDLQGYVSSCSIYHQSEDLTEFCADSPSSMARSHPSRAASRTARPTMAGPSP